MPTDVVMPQMGESIFEGTITKWLKQPGDKVQRDEPLFEISTDKVDAEIPAPASGTLQEIKVQAGATVQVNTVVGTIAGDGEGAATALRTRSEPLLRRRPRNREAQAPLLPSAEPTFPKTWPRMRRMVSSAKSKAPSPRPADKRAGQGSLQSAGPQDRQGEQRKPGAGSRNRPWRTHHQRRYRKLHRQARRGCGAAAPSAAGGSSAAAACSRSLGSASGCSAPATGPMQPVGGVTPGEIVPMSAMRKKIAEHMIMSKRTSAHVHGVFEVDVTRVVKLRER